jgi:hypothetical protein
MRFMRYLTSLRVGRSIILAESKITGGATSDGRGKAFLLAAEDGVLGDELDPVFGIFEMPPCRFYPNRFHGLGRSTAHVGRFPGICVIADGVAKTETVADANLCLVRNASSEVSLQCTSPST